MRKKIIFFGLLALMLYVLPAVAVASAETTAQTTVPGAFRGPGLPDPPNNEESEMPSYSYEINIPALYDTMAEEYMEITAQNVSVGSNKQVAVYVDSEKTLNNEDLLELSHIEYPQYKANGILIRTSNPDTGIREQITSEKNLVAISLDGDTLPEEYGYIISHINAQLGAVRGIYNGTIYFKIVVEDL